MITSKQNQTVKRVVALKQKKGREEFGCYVVEGVKMVSDALKFGAEVEEIFVTEKHQNTFLKAFSNVTGNQLTILPGLRMFFSSKTALIPLIRAIGVSP